MPCSGEAHRIRIGFFHPILMNILKKKSEKLKLKRKANINFTSRTRDKCTDFTCRCIVTTVCGLIFLVSVKCVLEVDKRNWYMEDIFDWFSGYPCLEGQCASCNMAQYYTTTCATNVILHLQDLLLLSGDIEQNPGPRETTRRNTSSMKKRASTDADSVRINSSSEGNNNDSSLSSEPTLTDIMDTLLTMNSDIQEVKSDLREVKEDYRNLHDEIKQLKCELDNIKDENKASRNETTKHLQETNTRNLELQEDIERIESYSRRNNVRFFGIPESEDSNKGSCEATIKDNLEKYLPQVKWESDTIERAHRLGRPNPGSTHPRPVIARFQRWSDAMRVMKDSEARKQMEKDGIRVRQDLTKGQSETLRQLRQEGKVGFFVRGKMHVRDQMSARPFRFVNSAQENPPTATITRGSREDRRKHDVIRDPPCNA